MASPQFIFLALPLHVVPVQFWPTAHCCHVKPEVLKVTVPFLLSINVFGLLVTILSCVWSWSWVSSIGAVVSIFFSVTGFSILVVTSTVTVSCTWRLSCWLFVLISVKILAEMSKIMGVKKVHNVNILRLVTSSLTITPNPKRIMPDLNRTPDK